MPIEFKSVVHRHSIQTGIVPSSTELYPGELALNLIDQKLFTMGVGGNIIDLTSANSMFSFSGVTAGAVLIYDSASSRFISEGGASYIRAVADVPARDAILPERRQVGMLVYVVDVGKYYTLTDGILNTDWVEFDGVLTMDGGVY